MGSLLADRAVDRFVQEVGAAGVTGSLLNKMQQHPAEREVATITQCLDRQLIQTCRCEHDFPASITGFAVAAAQLHRRNRERFSSIGHSV